MSKPTLIFRGGRVQPTSVIDLQPDIDAVRAIAQQEADASQDIVIIAHSWAGLPVSSALDGLSKSEREAAGQKGRRCETHLHRRFPTEHWRGFDRRVRWDAPAVEENGTVTASDPLVLFFHDVADGAEWVKLLKPHSWATQNAPATGAAYMNIPSVYLLTEEDRATPLPVQQVLVERARRRGGAD
ncbi:hypothetical protein N7491_006991 [Penicillium cf. griseofulvum]|nr:hypothetical protein N7491_006991 [Penicillium cf. griseofulvum]